VSDLSERLKPAAVAAIDDLLPAVMTDPSKLRLLTIEIELATGGTVRGGRAWLERAVNLRSLLESGPAMPLGEG
jgi:hypothetical protein